jgi:hypothetical protein
LLAMSLGICSFMSARWIVKLQPRGHSLYGAFNSGLALSHCRLSKKYGSKVRVDGLAMNVCQALPAAGRPRSTRR